MLFGTSLALNVLMSGIHCLPDQRRLDAFVDGTRIRKHFADADAIFEVFADADDDADALSEKKQNFYRNVTSPQ